MSSAIAWKPEEATDALKEFVGQIVAVDYSNDPFGFKGAPGIVRKGKVLGIQVRTDIYDKDQYELSTEEQDTPIWLRYKWYPPSRVKKTKPELGRLNSVGKTLRDLLPVSSPTGVRWLYFIEAMNECGAMKDVSIAGVNDDARMTSLAQSLLGMKFRFQEIQCESLVKEGGVFKKFSVLLPAEYLGKSAIEAVPEVRQATVGEVATPAKVPAEAAGRVVEPPTSQPPEV